MNRNTKAATIGGGGLVGVYVGDIVQFVVESLAGDLPDRIDQAIVGLTVAAVGYVLYMLLPRGYAT